jgi:uncharacterized membrane protein YczE
MELFGGLGALSFCFYIVFWAAGRVVGQHYRRDDKSLVAVSAFFLLGMYATSIVLTLAHSASPAEFAFSLIPCLINTVLMAVGFLMGKTGFGCGS